MPVILRPRKKLNYSETRSNHITVKLKEKKKVNDNSFEEPSLDVSKNIKKRKQSYSVIIPTDKRKRIKNELLVYVCGENDMGQLGLLCDSREEFSAITSVEQRWDSVACGGVHTIVLGDNGIAYSWGCNDEGALGRITEEPDEDVEPILGKSEKLPGRIKFQEKQEIISVSAGDSHTCLLSRNGHVFICGNIRDSNGPIGLTIEGKKSFEFICIYNDSSNPAVSIQSGCDHLLILTKNGTIYSFGNGEQGQLGRVDGQNNKKLNKIDLLTTKILPEIEKKKTILIGCGSYHSFCVTKDGDVYCWGLDNYGQLGLNQGEGDLIKFRPTFNINLTNLNKKDPIKKICGGQHHSIVLTLNGFVYSFGRYEYGRLGLGKSIKQPQFLPMLLDIKEIDDIACGDAVTFMIDKHSNLYGCGMITSKQLGLKDDDENDVYIPTNIPINNVICISSGGQHSALLAYI